VIVTDGISKEGLAMSRLTMEDILNAPALKRVSKKLRQLVRNSIRIETTLQAKDLPIGASKFGGLPDLPDGLEWPCFWHTSEMSQVPDANAPTDPPSFTPLPLVAQIRLSDVAAYDLEHRLPPKGWLWFFTDRSSIYELHGLGAFYAGTWCSKVLFCPDEGVKLHRREPPEGLPGDRPWKVRKLEFRSELILPKDETTWIESAGPRPQDAFIHMRSEEIEAFWKLRDEYVRDAPTHRLLGYADNVYGYLLENGYERARSKHFPRLPKWERLTSTQQHKEYRKGTLLLQVTTHDDMMFGRGACGAFGIRNEDLKAKRFNRVWYND